MNGLCKHQHSAHHSAQFEHRQSLSSCTETYIVAGDDSFFRTSAESRYLASIDWKPALSTEKQTERTDNQRFVPAYGYATEITSYEVKNAWFCVFGPSI